MSYEALLTDRCDIYHLKERQGAGKYNTPGKMEHYYADTPDVNGVACYWVDKGQTVSKEQPNTKLIQSFLVHFPITADIRINDKAIFNGQEFTLQLPKKIRNHHYEVTVTREVSI